jgi:pimeloyl-ACP methyl ester carboxylesterase
MPDDVLIENSAPYTEEPIQFGEGGRLLGILTRSGVRPVGKRTLPVFVFLSAGLLHRAGPYRLYVRLSRELAEMGFSSLRLDVAGVGDSSPRAGLTTRDSIAADFADVLSVLDAHFAPAPLVLAGLCTGADNAVWLALDEPRVVSLILLDPFCYRDRGYRLRGLLAKYADPARYVAWARRRLSTFLQPPPKIEQTATVDPLALRDLPSLEQMREVFRRVRERHGFVLTVFTDYARLYYNGCGQLGRALRVPGYQQCCTEIFWPRVRHTYWQEEQRRRLMEEVKAWARQLMPDVERKTVANRVLAVPERAGLDVIK